MITLVAAKSPVEYGQYLLDNIDPLLHHLYKYLDGEESALGWQGTVRFEQGINLLFLRQYTLNPHWEEIKKGLKRSFNL